MATRPRGAASTAGPLVFACHVALDAMHEGRGRASCPRAIAVAPRSGASCLRSVGSTSVGHALASPCGQPAGPRERARTASAV